MKLILKSLSAFFSWLSLPRALSFGRGLGWIYGSLLRIRRKDAREALTRCFPEKSPAEIQGILKRMYANLGTNLVELFRLSRMSDEFLREHVRFDGEHLVQEAVARGKGVIILTAHIGNWDLLAAGAPMLGYPLTIITKDIKNRALNDFWMEIRRRFGMKTVPAHQSYRACLHVLKKGELLGFILDQNTIKEEGVFVDFFGRLAGTTPGMAYMAFQSGSPVVPAFMLRQANGDHVIKILPLMEPPPDREPATILAFTQKYTKIIEDIVRQYPDQWTWVHRRWRSKPYEAGEGPVHGRRKLRKLSDGVER